MTQHVAVVYTDLDGTTPLKCKKTDMANIDALALDADERYLRVAIIKDVEGNAGGPFVDNESGHDCIGLHYNSKAKNLGGAPPAYEGRLLLSKCDVGGGGAIKQSSWTNPAAGAVTVKFNKAFDSKLNSALTESVQFGRYEGNDVNSLENTAMSLDVTDDANCEWIA